MAFNADDPTQLAELQSELINDPATRGYSGSSDGYCAVLLNEVQGSISIDVSMVSNSRAMSAVIGSELTSLQAADRDSWAILMQCSEIDMTDTQIRGQITEIWTGKTTLTNLQALQTRTGSRAEELWGENSIVQHEAVSKARAL